MAKHTANDFVFEVKEVTEPEILCDVEATGTYPVAVELSAAMFLEGLVEAVSDPMYERHLRPGTYRARLVIERIGS